ncbi:hypothetical protein IWQ47_001290 [Aquimarina sp. EL_43]|uniref:hypothetical protein n=1 Tax=unclassified Aquimarina TaxID=2627091 RepID=UPI0018CB22FC|nr:MULTISPECIES: hypothetical protein [unclassified Aquimarina]MBG6129407.1 hypothetical protein [Aquimarina sp. EL_35]MBG6150472.1 hypothetical protein [Aquimarina sp. EL_32]MBG6168220.1 hypothetical protein [Aquimarina sp. EL_43]
MKKIIPLIFLFIYITIFSQDQKTNLNQSNAEIFSNKSGSLIEKQFKEVGKVDKTEIKIVKLTDMISGESISSLRLERRFIDKYTSDTKIASLDTDEISALIKSIEIIRGQVFSFPPENYTEISFRSRSGFEAGCYWNKNIWKPYIQFKKNDRKSLLRLNKPDFLNLLALIKQAKKELN